jgi:YegS/Rv2252/BmrU family lipid kinase
MKAQFIYNPVAGQRDVADDLTKVIAYLESEGWQVTSCKTLGPGDATTHARAAAANHYDMVVSVGGDGTLGEVATGLIGSDCVLGVLPVGTGNIWAHMVGLPVWTPVYRSALMDAAHILVEGSMRPIDLGKVGDRYFVLWAGAGFDAKVIHEIEPHRDIRRSFGNVAYVVTAVAQSLVLRGTRVTVVVDGKAVRQRAILILVSNAQLYGPSWRIAPQAQLDDGLLEVYVFKGINTIDLFRHLASILLGKHLQDPKIDSYRGKHIEIRGEKPLPFHMDGDPQGYTPTTITIVPKALRVIIPSWTSNSLFEQGGFSGKKELSLAQRIAERLRYEREHWREQGERIRDDWEHRLGMPTSGRSDKDESES